MPRSIVSVLGCFLFAAATAAATHAQSMQSTQPAPNAATAESSTQNSAAGSASSAQKKVWTNDDLSGIDSQSGVSIVGNQPRNAKNTARRAVPSGHNARWYRDQIARLQAKLPPLDSQIAALQSAIDGKSAGDAKKSVRPYYGIKSDDWSQELAELQKRRDDTLAQIGGLRDQARHAGVPSNTLP